jgi:ABC-type dipeptide/oligopeptide/nickel transport system permease subunit
MSRELRWGIGLSVLLAVLAVLGPWLAPDPLAQPDLVHGVLQPPSLAHWLGTDQYSRDVFARLASGARTSLGVAMLAVLVAVGLGAVCGLVAGGGEGAVARTMGHLINLGLALPRTVVLLVLLAALGTLPSPLFAMVLGLTGWPAIARLVRGETLRLRHARYVEAARALGSNAPRVLWREILPGTLVPVAVAASLGVADAILLEAGLSFLGLGVQPPQASWGGMILDARDYFAPAPRLLLAPSLALVTATVAATLLGEALRRRLHPESS